MLRNIEQCAGEILVIIGKEISEVSAPDFILCENLTSFFGKDHTPEIFEYVPNPESWIIRLVSVITPQF